ncbi:MAG: GNAT family N-acetyltransferase [Promethearchaeota archaeon]
MEILNRILEQNEFKKPEKLKDLSIEIYNDSDFNNLMGLYERVFPGYMSKNLWLWKNNYNPFGKFYTLLMKDKNDIISAYSVAPKIFSIYGKQFSCVQSMDTMTDLKYRSKGISTYLARLIYEYAKIKGVNFVYGFPNKISKNLIFDKLNWEYFGKRNFITKKISKYRTVFENKSDLLIREIKKFNEDIDHFWEDYKNYFPIIIEKKFDYLKWRFDEHPLEKYKKYLIYNSDYKTISYFILKRFKDKQGNLIGHIVDYLIGPQDKPLRYKIFKLIHYYSLNEFKSDCKKISLWIPEEDLFYLAIKDLHYFKNEKKKFFGYKILKSNKNLSPLKISKNWYITMSDSDVF